MVDLFGVSGSNLDRVYLRIQHSTSAMECEIRSKLEDIWDVYRPFADPDFPEGFARDPEARFWEMFMGCQLLNAGRTLMATKDRQKTGGQPDLCVLDKGRRIWIEAIAPEVGQPGPDQVRGPMPISEGGSCELAPTRQAQLRTTSALLNKARRIKKYLQEGVITNDEVCLIAIGAGRFGALLNDRPFPLILSSVFPIGPEEIKFDLKSFEIVDRGFQPSFHIDRTGAPVFRTAFLDEEFSEVSGVLWSRVGIGNMSRALRPLSLVHNPLAKVPMPQKWGVWDREFVAIHQEDHWFATDILATE